MHLGEGISGGMRFDQIADLVIDLSIDTADFKEHFRV